MGLTKNALGGKEEDREKNIFAIVQLFHPSRVEVRVEMENGETDSFT